MLTIDQCMAMQPCEDYPRARVESLWAGREALTALDVAALAIPPDDRLWCLLRMAPREDWLPAIYAAAERSIRAASRALHAAGLTEESARLEHLRPIVDELSALTASDAALTARAAAWAARTAARAAARAAANAAAWAASDAARADDLETTVAHVARLIDSAAKGGAE